MSSDPKNLKINWLTCVGDSITNTDWTNDYIPKNKQYPYLIKQLIGGNCRERNLGVPGNTTTQMLARIWDITRYKPTVATIYGGINDWLQSVSDATTQSNLESLIDNLRGSGCSNIILCNIHKLKNGDANYTSKRSVIQSVANNKNVVFCDFYTITFDNDLDYNADGLHLSTSGLQKLADKLKGTIDAQNWTGYLQS